MKTKLDPNDYDILECPRCDKKCKPTAVSEKINVSYKHVCIDGSYTFKIDVNGDLVE